MSFRTLSLVVPLLFQVAAFTTVAQGRSSGIDEARTAVVRTPEDWKALWQLHQPDLPVPKIDFSRDMVVAVFLGTRPTAGYSVTITGIRTKDGVTVVSYAESRPSPDRMVAQVLSSPFHLVRISRINGSVEFKKAGDPSAAGE